MDEATATVTPRRRFADFSDPFAAGQAAGWPPEELVRYSFAALEAWAAEHGHPRQAEQTPHEFARSIASNFSLLAKMRYGWRTCTVRLPMPRERCPPLAQHACRDCGG